MASSEVAPFAKTGGLADVAGSLPIALKSLGYDVAVFMPFYRETKKGNFKIKPVKKDIIFRLADTDFVFSLYHCKSEDVDFYFIEKDEFFNRDYLYTPPSGDYPDNDIRFAFFVMAALEGALAINFKPDIIHCHDWQTALLPFYLRFKLQNLDFFKNTKTLFTVHNLGYQGLFPKEAMQRLGISDEFFTIDTLEFYGKISFMKSGLLYSDAINAVSKGYAAEILTEEHGCGLAGLLNVLKDKLYGIINGADYSQWNPKTDKYIVANYDKSNLQDKVKCKEDLILQTKLKISSNAPLLGVVTRLAEQKGIDIIADSIKDIIKSGCGLIILGLGDEKYHKLLTALAKKHSKNLAVKIAFDNTLAHKIEAGCDMFLMPSRYEPCGLNQMYSLKYGTIPVVRATGGLDDTIVDYTQDPKNGNGFKFQNPNTAEFIDAIKRAISLYKDKKAWHKLLIKAMECDFSWKHSAKEYIHLYTSL